LAVFLFIQHQGEVWQLLANTGLVARITLFILLFFSVLSWAIIFKKYTSFASARVKSRKFLEIFRRSRKLSEIRAASKGLTGCPLAEVFLAGYREIENQVTFSENPGTPRVRSMDAIERAMQIASSAQLAILEQWLSWLATIAAATPFIGLFGTVWGIIDAFQGLGSASSASLRSVAPGISEALVTTAAGLFAAIPALIAYNQFVQRLKEFGAQMDDFRMELLNMTERHFT
jgi:biopolymer transport protein TolQ